MNALSIVSEKTRVAPEIWTPNLSALEIDLTYNCGFGCNNCNRMTVVAPGTPDTDITLPQMEKMIRESIDLDWQWKSWRLLGGEPTTHPQFFEILRMITDYRSKHRKKLVVGLATHGAGNKTKEALERIRVEFPYIRVQNTKKTTKVHLDFDAVNIAPRDLDPDWAATHKYNGCWIPKFCGIGFNYSGFYCCAVAGAIDRVCGDNLSITSLHNLTTEGLIAQYQPLCAMCGHYRPIKGSAEHLQSHSWKTALQVYEDHKPQLKRY
jgi:hypothetical protein